VVRLADETASGTEIRSLVDRYGWIVDTSRQARTDLELVCQPGRGRFTRKTDCRVLACFQDSAIGQAALQAAQVVLSPGGQVGELGQIRLRLDDAAGFWDAVTGNVAGMKRMAA
jgi:hypothetical protein